MIGNKKAKEVNDPIKVQWHILRMSRSQVIFKEDGQLVETRLQQVFQVCSRELSNQIDVSQIPKEVIFWIVVLSWAVAPRGQGMV